MLMLNCFYKLNDRILYLLKTCGYGFEDGMRVLAYDCMQADNDSDMETLLQNKYIPCGTPFLIEIDALQHAENLNVECFDCIYCRRQEYLFDRAGNSEKSLLVPSSEVGYTNTICDLRLGLAADEFLYGMMFVDCDYRRTSTPDIRPVTVPPITNIKAYFRIAAEKNKPVHISSRFYALMPSTFVKLVLMLEPNEPVYLATGESFENGRRFVHERFSEYLEANGSDADVICLQASDATRDVYCYLNSEKQEYFHSAICIPALDLAIYPDDWTNGRGYMLCAPSAIVDFLKKEDRKITEGAFCLFSEMK